MKKKMLELKGKCGKKVLMCVAVANACAIPVFAAEPGGASTAMVAEFTSLKAEALTAMTAIVGLAVGIFGFKWIFRTVKGFFKSSTSGN